MSELNNALLLAATRCSISPCSRRCFAPAHRLGIGAFFCALGVMHFLETYLASIFYVALPFGIVTSPGSTVLFTGKLMLLLLVYIREDAVVVRQPIYGLLIGNLLMVALAFLMRHHDVGRARAGPRRRFRLPRRDGRADGLGHGDPVRRLHLHHPALRTLTGLARPTACCRGSRSPARPCSASTSRRSIVRPACRSPARRVAVLVGGWVAKMGAVAALQRARLGLSALARAAAAPAPQRAAHRGCVRHADLPRALRGPAGAHRARCAHRRARPRPAGGAGQARDRGRRCWPGGRSSLLLIDIDHFKSFNDRFGHAAGDHVLKRIASSIMTTVRTDDLVFRFGGEEFVVICDGMAADPALALGERIRREVAGSEDGASQRHRQRRDRQPAPRTPPTMTGCSRSPTGGSIRPRRPAAIASSASASRRCRRRCGSCTRTSHFRRSPHGHGHPFDIFGCIYDTCAPWAHRPAERRKS